MDNRKVGKCWGAKSNEMPFYGIYFAPIAAKILWAITPSPLIPTALYKGRQQPSLALVTF